MTGKTEATRKAFEAYVKLINPEDYADAGEKLFEWNGASYAWTWVNWDWQLWCAALDSVVVELPELPGCKSTSPTGVLLDKERTVAILQCRNAIHAAGVQTK